MVDFAAALSALGSALTIAKELREIDVHFDKAELKLKIADLTQALANAQIGLVDAREALQKKDAELSAARELLRFRDEQTVLENGYRYRATDAGEPIGHPYCAACLAGGIWIETVTSHTPGMPIVCPKCDADYGYNINVYGGPRGR